MNAGLLLHDVGGLVSGGVQVGVGGEGDPIAGGVGRGTDGGRGLGGGAADRGADVPELVLRSEASRDALQVRQRPAGVGYPGGGDGVDAHGIVDGRGPLGG